MQNEFENIKRLSIQFQYYIADIITTNMFIYLIQHNTADGFITGLLIHQFQHTTADVFITDKLFLKISITKKHANINLPTKRFNFHLLLANLLVKPLDK